MFLTGHGRSKYRYFAAKGGNGGLELDEDHDPESAMDEITPRASKLEATVNHVSNRRTPSPGVDMQDIDVEAPAFTVANESDDSDNSPSNGIGTRKSRRTRRPVARRGAGSDDEQEL